MDKAKALKNLAKNIKDKRVKPPSVETLYLLMEMSEADFQRWVEESDENASLFERESKVKIADKLKYTSKVWIAKVGGKTFFSPTQPQYGLNSVWTRVEATGDDLTDAIPSVEIFEDSRFEYDLETLTIPSFPLEELLEFREQYAELRSRPLSSTIKYIEYFTSIENKELLVELTPQKRKSLREKHLDEKLLFKEHYAEVFNWTYLGQVSNSWYYKIKGKKLTNF